MRVILLIVTLTLACATVTQAQHQHDGPTVRKSKGTTYQTF